MAENNQWEEPGSIEQAKKFVGRIVSKWYWVVGSLALALTIAFLINRYEDPVYVVNASFISKKFDDKRSEGLAGILGEEAIRQRIEVYEEIPLLKSQDKIEETLQRLNFGISYYNEGRFKTSEIYKDFVVEVDIDSSSTFIPYGQNITLQPVDDFYYQLDAEEPSLKELFGNKKFRYGDTQNLKGWIFKIKRSHGAYFNRDYSYYFVIHQPSVLVSKYRNKLNISWQQRGSAILAATIRSELPEKDHDFLRTYIQVVIDKGLEEKNQYLVNTIDFINEYMGDISDTLLTYQKRMDEFRLENRELINGSSYIFQQLNDLDKEKTEVILANSYYDYLLRYIDQHRQSEVFAPDLIGLDAPLLSELVNKYIGYKWEDKVDKNEFNEKNPLVNKNHEEFERIEQNIKESVRSLRETNIDELRELNEQIGFYYNSVQNYQLESREYSETKRMLSLYENLFNNLLAKRTDAYITKASTTSDYQVVTPPTYSRVPVYPDKEKNIIIAALIGLALPIGLIYLSHLLNTKIVSKEDLLKNTTIPLIGNIGHSHVKDNLVVLKRPKSLVSESFRGIRANLQYFLQDNKMHKTVLITSSISSEGKTFCSINLAYTFAIAGKKTVLVGADLRRPTLAKNFDLKHAPGLSQYLAGVNSLESVINPTEKENLFVLPSGNVPPNPAELLNSAKMDELMILLKERYEIVIIDTPPIGLVSDTLELIRHSDVNLLIVRQGKSFKKSLEAITEMYEEGKVENLGIVFNDIDFRKLQYGYSYGYKSKYGYGYGYGNGYGYGYYEDEGKKKRSWLGRLIGRG